jgi:hypothetical protein
MKYLFPLLFLVILVPAGFSQDLPDIGTDRPDQSEASSTVPKKTLQIESGFVWQGDKQNQSSVRNLDVFNTLLRYGIFDNWELRVGLNIADVNISPDDGSPDTNLRGLVPVALGTKIYITKQKGAIPELAFLATLTIPNTGSKDFDILNMASDFRFAMGWDLSERFSAGANIGAQWNTIVPGGSGFYSAVVGVSIIDPIGAFIEVYGWLPENELPDHRMDAGFTFLLRRNLQLDVSGGLGLSDISPDYFVNAGVSWRIPR